MEELKVKFDLDFRFKNVKGETEKDSVFPAYELLAEFLTRQASDSKEKRAKLFNWGMKLMDQRYLMVTKNEIEQIMEAIVATNMSNLYYMQLEAVAEKCKEEISELKKAEEAKKKDKE